MAVLQSKRRRRSRGMLVLETLITLFLALLTGAAMLSLLHVAMIARSTTMNPANADMETRVQIDNLADQVRNAQGYLSGSTYVCFSAAATSSVTCYTNSTGDTMRYWLNTSTTPYSLQQTKTVAGVATTTTILNGVTALQYTYYKQTSSDYNAVLTGWQTTTNANAPTAAEMPMIGAIKISLTYTVNGSSRQMSTLVRLRNSPWP